MTTNIEHCCFQCCSNVHCISLYHQSKSGWATEQCHMIQDENGIFGNCINVIQQSIIQDFYQQCITSACRYVLLAEVPRCFLEFIYYSFLFPELAPLNTELVGLH